MTVSLLRLAADAASERSGRTPHMGSPNPGPKNGGVLRPGAPGLPLKIPSAMRKRPYDETQGAVSCGGLGAWELPASRWGLCVYAERCVHREFVWGKAGCTSHFKPDPESSLPMSVSNFTQPPCPHSTGQREPPAAAQPGEAGHGARRQAAEALGGGGGAAGGSATKRPKLG
jgi:hypothetical protein